MTKNRFTVYALTCGGEIRYIGITSQAIKRRLMQHLADVKRAERKEHKTNWIRKCLSAGLEIKIKPLRQWMSEQDACRIERQIIAKLRPSLVNVHDGGTSGYYGLPQEAKDRHRDAMQKAAKTRDFTSFSKAGRAAREANRLARIASEPPRVEWRGRHEWRITHTDHIQKTKTVLDLFRGKRRDQFAAEVDGKPWRTISATQLGDMVRDKFKPHIK